MNEDQLIKLAALGKKIKDATGLKGVSVVPDGITLDVDAAEACLKALEIALDAAKAVALLNEARRSLDSVEEYLSPVYYPMTPDNFGAH